jgi:prepilin-type N-terminal cleavage/methylation domain-containing protein
MMSPTGSDPHLRRPEAGFTLVELLIVILILTVMVGISAPRFRHTFRHLQLQLFAYDVAKVLTYASRRAVARGEMLRIHFDVEGRHYWLLRAKEASPEAEFERIDGKFGRRFSVPGAISLDPRARAVTFYPDGRADPFEMIIFDNSQEKYRLVTDVWTGRVKLLESHGK